MKKLAVILGVASSSVSAVLVRITDAPSMVLVFYRVGFASAFLLPFFLTAFRRERANIPRRDYLLSAVSGVFLGFHFTAFFQSLRYTSISSSVVLVDTEVFFIALMTFLFFHEKMGMKSWVGIFLTFVGSVVIALADAGGGSNVLLGDFIALGGACCMAVYTMLGAICRRHMSTTVYTFLVYSFAALTVLLVLSVQGVGLVGYGAVNYLSGLGLALFCTLMGHSLFSWSLKYVKPAFVSASKMLEPVFATVWGIVFFLEIPSLFVVAGGILVVAGIIYYSLKSHKENIVE